MSELSRRNILFGAFGLAGLATVSACGGTTAVPSTAPRQYAIPRRCAAA
jgi:hypothetical protein